MDFQIRPKTDLSISDNKHMENSIISDFISFNMYKSRISRQLDELAGLATIDGNTYYTTIDLHNKLSQAGSPQRKLLEDFGFPAETIQEIINFNNAEDLDYLRLAWKYKLVVSKDDFDLKISELRDLLPSGCTILLTDGAPDSVKINGVLTVESTSEMLYSMHLSNKITYTTKTVTDNSPNPNTIEYTDAGIDSTAEDLFLSFAGDSEIYEGAAYSVFSFGNFLPGTETAELLFWRGYKTEEVTEYSEENNKMFYLYNNDPLVVPIAGYIQFPVFNNPYMWVSKRKMRSATRKEYLYGMARYMNIDYKLDENWFERFVGGIVNAILGLLGTIIELIASIPILGDIFEFVVENIGKLFGLDSFEEVVVYLKQILLVIITLVIAYYTGDFSYTQAAIAGWGTAATYAIAFMEIASAIGSILGAIDTAEAQWRLMEKEEQDEIDKELEEDQSPENRLTSTDAPDREQDYLYEQMFTVPDWGIDHSMTLSDQEPPMKFLNI